MQIIKTWKIFITVLMGALFILAGTATISASELEADITHEGSVSKFNSSKITDKSHKTAISFDAGDKLIVKAKDESKTRKRCYISSSYNNNCDVIDFNRFFNI